MTTDFDRLLDQALLEFSSVDIEKPNEIQLPGQEDYSKILSFLEEVSEDDEKLAKSELESMAFIESTKLDEEDSELTESLVNDEIGWFNKSNWELTGEGEFIHRSGDELYEEVEDKNISKSNKEEIKRRRLNGLKRFYHNRDLRKIEINRMAFDQKVLPLGDVITKEHKRLLISLLTEPINKMINQYENYINKRIGQLLLPAIPSPVKMANLKWPWLFIPNPGFLYKTHPHFGKVISFYANPKIPYYFHQGTEQTILEERDAALSHYNLDRIDRVIHYWDKSREKLADKQIRYAVKLVNLKGNTYYHLLIFNPFWFELLFNSVKKSNEIAAADLL